MIRILSLLWTLILSLIVTGISFFYIKGEARGFPFSYSVQTTDQFSGAVNIKLSVWSLVLDVIFWWFIFSILWIILKNYVFEI